VFSLGRRFTAAAEVGGVNRRERKQKKIQEKNRRTSRPAHTHPPPGVGHGREARKIRVSVVVAEGKGLRAR